MPTVRSAVPKNSRRWDTPPQVGVKSMKKIPETLKQTNSQMMEFKFRLKFINGFKRTQLANSWHVILKRDKCETTKY